MRALLLEVVCLSLTQLLLALLLLCTLHLELMLLALLLTRRNFLALNRLALNRLTRGSFFWARLLGLHLTWRALLLLLTLLFLKLMLAHGHYAPFR